MQKRKLRNSNLEVSALGLGCMRMAFLEELGIGLVPSSLLGRGYLTGKIDENTTYDSTDIRTRNPRFNPEAIKANRVVIDLLENIATQKGGAPAQIALAWLLA